MTVTDRFPLLGEPLALDLVNTRVRRDGADVDLLGGPEALTEWLHAERERILWTGSASAADLAAVCAMRDAIDGLLGAFRGQKQPSAGSLARVNRALSNPPARSRLKWGEDGPSLASPPARSRRRALLHVLAVSAVDVLMGPHAGKLRLCAHPDCRLQFVAKNARRRWCSDALCGNRARVARHYRRRHETE